MTGLELELLAILFAVAIGAAVIDSIGGGGGLVTVPVLMMAGLDPLSAIATNKVLATAATVSSASAYGRKGLIDWRRAAPAAAIAGAASLLGALGATLLPRATLEAIVPILLIAIAVYFGFARRIGDADVKARMSQRRFSAMVVPAVGFYDGLFGPGAGSFYMAGFVAARGYGLVKATALTKTANAASNFAGLVFFVAAGAVVWSAGLVMALGSIIGAQIGARLAMAHGARLIRPLIVLTSCAMALRLLADPSTSVGGAIARVLSP